MSLQLVTLTLFEHTSIRKGHPPPLQEKSNKMKRKKSLENIIRGRISSLDTCDCKKMKLQKKEQYICEIQGQIREKKWIKVKKARKNEAKEKKNENNKKKKNEKVNES